MSNTISVLRAKDTQGNDTVAVILSPGAVFTDDQGQPIPGIALPPAEAKLVAYRLLSFAQEIENAGGNGRA